MCLYKETINSAEYSLNNPSPNKTPIINQRQPTNMLNPKTPELKRQKLGNLAVPSVRNSHVVNVITNRPGTMSEHDSSVNNDYGG